MVIVQKPKFVSYWFLDKTENGKGVFMSQTLPRNKRYVKVVAVNMLDGRFISTVTYGEKKVIIEDDGKTCKSGFKYSYDLQKLIYKLLKMPFPETTYKNLFRDKFKKDKKKGLCN